MSTLKAGKWTGYHHGNLRIAAINAGLEILSRQQTEDVSLRAVARAVGVSVNALYRHFPNKGSFLTALAQSGMNDLAEKQISAVEGIEPGLKSLQAMGLVYINLAMTNPALFRLMSRRAFSPIVSDKTSEDLPPAQHKMRVQMEASMPKGISVQQKNDASMRAWALVHGIACLILEGQIPRDLATIKRIMTTTVFWD